MAQTLTEWLNGEVKQLQKMPVSELSNTFFFRDPLRPTYIDSEHFYSPADGTILYQKMVLSQKLACCVANFQIRSTYCAIQESYT